MNIRKILAVLMPLMLCAGVLAEPFALPAGTVRMEAAAFRDCADLTGALVIPEGVTEVGAYAFAGFTCDDYVTLVGKLLNGTYSPDGEVSIAINEREVVE